MYKITIDIYSLICYNIYSKGQGKVRKTRKANTMKKKIVIRSFKTCMPICEIIVDEDWDFYDLFEQMTDEQFAEFKNSFVYFFNNHFPAYFDEPLTLNDIEHEEDFMEFLEDYYEDTYEDTYKDTYYEDDHELFQITDVVLQEDENEDGMTIRQLYELAKEHNIENMPLSISYYCNDDWYGFTKRTFTKDMFDIETADICFDS